MESNLVLLKIPENKLKLYWCRLCFKIFNDNPLYGISHDSCMFGTIQQINEVRCTCKYSSELFCFDIKILLKLTHSLQQVMESVTYFWRKIWILGNKTPVLSASTETTRILESILNANDNMKKRMPRFPYYLHCFWNMKDYY